MIRELKKECKLQKEETKYFRKRLKYVEITQIVVCFTYYLVSYFISTIIALCFYKCIILTSDSLVLKVTLGIAIFLYLIYKIIGIKFFKDQRKKYLIECMHKIYGHFILRFNKAVTSRDLKVIKKECRQLYDAMLEYKCHQLCYSTCFYLLKTLKKGTIKFVSMRDYLASPNAPKNTLHCIYVNNGYVCDCYSLLSYKEDEFDLMFKTKFCASYSYEDIKNVEYEEFVFNEEVMLYKWCYENDTLCKL